MGKSKQKQKPFTTKSKKVSSPFKATSSSSRTISKKSKSSTKNVYHPHISRKISVSSTSSTRITTKGSAKKKKKKSKAQIKTDIRTEICQLLPSFLVSNHFSGNNHDSNPSFLKQHQHFHRHAIPWLQQRHQQLNQHSTQISLSNQTKKHDRRECNNILPIKWYQFQQSIIHSFNEEIEAFASYVQLTPTEINTRDFVTQELENISKMLFFDKNQMNLSDVNNKTLHNEGSRKRSRNSSEQEPIMKNGDFSNFNTIDEENNAYLQVFGSFATKQVCTFYSDVDLALWNAIPTIENSPHSKSMNKKLKVDFSNSQSKKQPLNNGDENDSENNDFWVNTSTQKAHSVSKSDRIQKWREAITEQEERIQLENEIAKTKTGTMLSSQNITTTVTSPTFSDDKDVSVQNKDAYDTNDEQPLFILDYKPYIDDSVKSNDANQKEEIACDNNADTVIDLTEEDEIHSIVSSSDDSADKMNTFTSNIASGLNSDSESSESNFDKSNDDDDDDSASDDKVTYISSDDDHESDDGPSLNIITDFASSARNMCPNNSPGLNGESKRMVLKALSTLSRKIRRNSIASNVEFRSRAKVPIISISTMFGFDTDIACGGHNGADTSHYVRAQAEKYRHFSTVVLVLKILLRQANLDKPFTGGLGSYKLYVMLAHHYDLHLNLGGNDTSAEILMSFLYRFGQTHENQKQKIDNKKAVTPLSQLTILSCNGGEADLSTIFKIENCTHLFGICFQRVMMMLEATSNGGKLSYLASIIHGERLRVDRMNHLQKTILCEKMQSGQTIPRDDPGKVSQGRRINHVFSKSNSDKGTFNSFQQRNSSNMNYSSKTKRDSRGALIPKFRPDAEARKSETFPDVISRARKNRKNKKKQTRDKALYEFAMSF